MIRLSGQKQKLLNIVAAIAVVVVNTCINFFLSPFIVEHLGVEANGYISLANNFVSYFGIIVTALNSMAGRFMLIEYRKGNIQEANEYYASVLFGDWFLAAVLLTPALVLIIKLDSFIQVTTSLLVDVKVLFALVFFNFFFTLCIPKWSNATYTKNKLYLRSLKTMVTTIIRALIIFIAYCFFKPYAYYVALAGLIMTFANTVFEYYFKIILIPEMRVKFKYYNFKKIRELISSGIWNTISQCGNILLEGLDLLLANLFIDPFASGVLALSKIVPNMVTQITGTVSTTFGPGLTELFADGDKRGMVDKVKNDMKIISVIANIPIGIIFALGTYFYTLWIPSQDPFVLTLLTSLTLIGLLFSGISNGLNNIFIAANKLRANSLIIILTGLFNVGIVYILLKNTDLGVYAVAGVSSLVTVIRIMLFTAPYAAKCIDQPWYIFYSALIKGALNVIIPVGVGTVIGHIIGGTSWMLFIICVGITGALATALDYFLVLNSSERAVLLKTLNLKK